MIVHSFNHEKPTSNITFKASWNLKGQLENWFIKTAHSNYHAFAEILAQEFFRLIIPTQIETRLAALSYEIDSSGEQASSYFVMSKEILNFQPLPFNLEENVNVRKFKDLGQVMLLSVFLNEIDLKFANMGLQGNRIIKFDGDWCFPTLLYSSYQDKDFYLTGELVNCLPLPLNYMAYNWLDYIRAGNMAEDKTTKTNYLSISQNPLFRKEINHAMLRIILLPPLFLNDFVKSYLPSNVEQMVFVSFLLNRRIKLENAALGNFSFQAYLLSTDSRENMEDFLQHLISFAVSGQDQTIISKAQAVNLSDAFRQRLEQLQRSVLGTSPLYYLPREPYIQIPVTMVANYRIPSRYGFSFFNASAANAVLEPVEDAKTKMSTFQ